LRENDDVPTVPLLVIDYTLLRAGDEHEIDRLWQAATELGFWYLKNHGADAEVEAMLEMGAHTMALPFEEKMKFEQGDEGTNSPVRMGLTPVVHSTRSSS